MGEKKKIGAPWELVCVKSYHYASTNGKVYHTDESPNMETEWEECEYL